MNKRTKKCGAFANTFEKLKTHEQIKANILFLTLILDFIAKQYDADKICTMELKGNQGV